MGLTHAWLDELDVVGPRWRASVWGWAVLALGLALGLHAWQQHQQAHMALQVADDEVARLMRARQSLEREQAMVNTPVNPQAGGASVATAADAAVAFGGSAEPAQAAAPAAPRTAPPVAQEINGLAIVWALIKNWWLGLFGKKA